MCVREKSITVEKEINPDQMQWIILTEEKLELLIKKFIKDYFQKINDNLYLIEDNLSKNINSYAKHFQSINLEPRQKFTQLGSTMFREYKFPPDVKEWFQKSGIDEQLKIILSVNTDVFKNDFIDIEKSALLVGGQSAFKSLDLMIDFALRDLQVERYYEKYTIKLTDQLVSEIQSKIKYEILAGIKNAESISQIRDRVLSVYNKPITVNVNSKLSPEGKVLRAGYSYEMKANHWATTVARTEVMNAYSQGKLIGFKQMGVVDRVEFSTAPDERTCPICQSLNGSIFNLEDADGIIPQHPNCRCMWIPLLSESVEDETKLAYDNASLLYLDTLDMDTNVKGDIDNIINDNLQEYEELSNSVDEAIKDINIKINEFKEKYNLEKSKFIKEFKDKLNNTVDDFTSSDGLSKKMNSTYNEFNSNQHSENSKDFRYFAHKSLGSVLFFSKTDDSTEQLLLNSELVDKNDAHYYNQFTNSDKLNEMYAIKLNSMWHQNLFTRLFGDKEVTVYRSMSKEYLKEIGYENASAGDEIELMDNGLSVWTLYKGSNDDENNVVFSTKMSKKDVVNFLSEDDYKFILLNKNSRKIKIV